MCFRRWFVALPVMAVAASAAAQDQPNPSFYLINATKTAISHVFATPTGIRTWGQDRLTNIALSPGQYAAIRLPPDGHCLYDLRVAYANGKVEEKRALNTCDIDRLTLPSGLSAPSAMVEQRDSDPSFMLVNRGRQPVRQLYLSMTGDQAWGPDRLGDPSLPSGSTRVIMLPRGECVYDMRVVFANGHANERRRLNLCEITDIRVP